MEEILKLYNMDINQQNNIQEITLKKSGIRILLDPGHGNNTFGKKSPWSLKKIEPELPFEEWRWNREIAKGIQEELEKMGYNVVNLVPEDKDISLSERVGRANKICNQIGSSNCIYISIHANAAGNGTKWMNAKGFQVHISGNASKKSELLANLLYQEANNMGLKMRRPKPNQNYWINNFYVIKNTKCPAILSESGFYDNTDDCKFLNSEEGKRKIINLHVQAIIKYIKEVKL